MGRDRGKFNKRGGRGGGRSFHAESAAEIEIRNARIAEFDAARNRRREEAESDEDEEGGNNEAEEQEAVNMGVAGMSIGGGQDGDSRGVERVMTRKEKELAEKERAAAEYRRRHELGLTEEYKRDMAKLAEVRKRREEAQKKAKLEKESSEQLEKERRQKAEAAGALDDSDSDSEEDKKKKKKKSKKKGAESVPKLDKITIKKMKPTQLKEALKSRGLDIQGNAKALTQRLLDYEASR